MSMAIEDYLQAIDKVLVDKEPKEVYAILVMVAAVLGFLSYTFLFESSEKAYNKSLRDVQVLERNIATDEKFLKFNPKERITLIENTTKTIQNDFIEYKNANAYINYEIEKISSLFYDEKSWGAYIDSIIVNAKKYKIHLEELSNEFSDDKNNFGHVLDITIKSTSDYRNLLRFINSLEQSFLVVDINNINITTIDRKVETQMQISVWGITY
ncbi:MAG: hypothetical protein GQ570_06340 [Helicobacteraceae bacterium]|nr:hypothetical protein [Helicobacteraceae bacterium]